MRRMVKAVRKGVVAAIGFPLFLLGLVLIPLPGPGLVTCFIALFILSLEFDWANAWFEKTKAEIKKILDKSKAKQEEIKKRD